MISNSIPLSYCTQCDAVKTEGFIKKTIGGKPVKKTQMLSHCAQCHLAYYCNKDCQKKDWAAHKITCLKKSEEFVSVEKVRKIIEINYLGQTGRIILHLNSDQEYLYIEESTSKVLLGDKLCVDVKIENRPVVSYKFMLCSLEDEKTMADEVKTITGLEGINLNAIKNEGLTQQELLIGLSTIAEYASKNAIKYNDGTPMTERDNYLKMIELVPSNYLGYHNLAFTMQKNEKIQLGDGTVMTKHQLLLKAIQLEPNNPKLYYGLMDDLSYNDTIRLNEGPSMTAINFLIKVIELDPNCGELYQKLGFFLPFVKGSVKLRNGTRMTKQQLYLKAIELSPNQEHAYYSLANLLTTEGTVQLKNGTVMTAQQLCLKAFQLNPYHLDAYYNIACTLPMNGTIEFLDGKCMTQQHLFLKDIELNPDEFRGYHNLGSILPLKGTVQLKDGTHMTKYQLLLKGLEISPTYAGYFTLAYTLPEKGVETVLFNDGTRMTREQLMLKGKSLESSGGYFRTVKY
jgi:tetratricopeptide (TPR) repeat protein